MHESDIRPTSPWGKAGRLYRTLLTVAVLAGITLTAYLFLSGPVKAASPPPTPHAAGSFEQCLGCHSAQGVRPLPAGHVSADQTACLTCHPRAGALTASGGQCLGCHGQPGMAMTLASGETLSLYVNTDEYSSSVHGKGNLACADCHRAISAYPHSPLKITSVRDYSIAQYEVCKRCHFANYTKVLDSVHFDVLSNGNVSAPLCTDCHGAHDVTPPSKISQACANCHESVYRAYAGSVHGAALISGASADVPVCTDCHSSHTIEDPRTAAFRIESVDICSRCHSDTKLMQKYGISTNVVNTYLSDFHGRAVTLGGQQNEDAWVKEAVCTDCHGVHDIMAADSPQSPVMKANLVGTCQKCHPDASANFPSAWLSHYQPSLTKAPLVFLARAFYAFMIPFIILGLSIHVLLDLWRAVTNR